VDLHLILRLVEHTWWCPKCSCNILACVSKQNLPTKTLFARFQETGWTWQQSERMLKCKQVRKCINSARTLAYSLTLAQLSCKMPRLMRKVLNVIVWLKVSSIKTPHFQDVMLCAVPSPADEDTVILWDAVSNTCSSEATHPRSAESSATPVRTSHWMNISSPSTAHAHIY
jgi:hypothetical protein